MKDGKYLSEGWTVGSNEWYSAVSVFNGIL